MRHQSSGIDCQCARRLDSVCQLESERGPESRSALGNVNIERDQLPCFKNSAVALRKCIIAGAQRTSKNLGDRDRRDGEAQPPRLVRFEQRLEIRPKLRVLFEEVDDGCRIDKDQRIIRKIADL